MTDFHERLARMADAVRTLPGGDQHSRDLLHLAADVEQHIARERHDLTVRGQRAVESALELAAMITANTEAGRGALIRDEQLRIARLIASDPRWSGGYADVLKLVRGEADER